MGDNVFADRLLGQDSEVQLLAALRLAVRDPAAIDVGAERGDVSAALLDAGWAPLTLIEASPTCAAGLERRFHDENRVTILPLAAAERDGSLAIREASTESGERMPQFDAILSASVPASREHVFSDPIEIEARTLASLAGEGAVPARPGLLKVDVEGLEASVLRGAAGLEPEILMVEHWTDLPGTHGPCPWSFAELRGLASDLGLSRWAIFAHTEIHTRVELDAEGPEVGEWANVVFFADHLADAVDAALPAIRAHLERRLLAKAEAYRAAAEERLGVIAELEVAAGERLAVIAELEAVAEERLRYLERTTAELERLRAEVAKRPATPGG